MSLFGLLLRTFNYTLEFQFFHGSTFTGIVCQSFTPLGNKTNPGCFVISGGARIGVEQKRSAQDETDTDRGKIRQGIRDSFF